MVFATSHHIGLQLLPIDGNPYKALGYRASATPVSWLFFQGQVSLNSFNNQLLTLKSFLVFKIILQNITGWILSLVPVCFSLNIL